MFNEICIKEEMLPKYIYIYIYIYKISLKDKLGMIQFENILGDSYKSPGVLNVW